MNLLTKGSERHCRVQLGQTPEEHRKAVTQTFRAAKRKRIKVNAYLEDWSNGVRDSFDYVFAMVELLRDLGTLRIYLADTLGIMSPADVTRYVDLMVSTWPDVTFEFHAHNDYGLAAANVLASVRAGARGAHTSVNGLGERTGNARLAEVVAAIHDHTEFQTGVKEARLSSLSRLVETFSGKDVADNTPIVGRDVYTQTAGIHADGDAKGELYASRLLPARFGERRRYALANTRIGSMSKICPTSSRTCSNRPRINACGSYPTGSSSGQTKPRRRRSCSRIETRNRPPRPVAVEAMTRS